MASRIELVYPPQLAGRERGMVPAAPPAVDLAKVAWQLIAQHRRRAEFLPETRFEDPQWMMVLNLFVAAEAGEQVCVSDLCHHAGVPTTTALRHLASLEKEGVLVRRRHPSDQRCTHIALNETARDRVIAYLRAISAAG